jgi:hypothetical protein
MTSEDLEFAIFGPHWVAKCIHHFLSGAQEVNRDGIHFHLVFLLLPLIQNRTVSREIQNANKKSTFWSMIESNDDPKFRDALKRSILSIDEFRQYASAGLILLANETKLSFGESIVCDTVVDYKKVSGSLKASFKNSHNLGIIFAKEPPGLLVKKLEGLIS